MSSVTRFGETFIRLFQFFKGFLVFGKIANLLWQILGAIGQKFIVVKGQILKELRSHLVTLVASDIKHLACFHQELLGSGKNATTRASLISYYPLSSRGGIISQVVLSKAPTTIFINHMGLIPLAEKVLPSKNRARAEQNIKAK